MNQEASGKAPVKPTLHILQLHNVFLEAVEAERFPVDELEEKTDLSIDADTSSDVEGNNFVIGMTVNIKILEGEEQALSLSVRVIGFGVCENQELTEGSLQAFAQTSGIYLLMPYARMYIATITQFMGLPAMQLPLLSVPPVLLGAPSEMADQEVEEK